MTEHFNSADKNLQTWVEKAKDPIDKLFREKEALAVLASKEDLKASEADFQKLLVTPEMLATKYGARAAIRRKLMEPVDALVDKAIEHIEAQLDEKLANETDDEKIEQLQLKADAIIEKIVRELDNPSILGEWDAGEDSVKPPPRGWLLGNMFARRFLSILVAEGGVGKSAVQYAQLLSLAIGRSLTGDYVFQRCRVFIMCLEDGEDELRRRIQALCLFYKVKPEELKGWLYLSAPTDAKKTGKLMQLHRGQPMLGALGGKLEAMVQRYSLDVIALDPFIKVHGVAENDNEQIDMVASLLIGLAIKYDIAIALTHHTNKLPNAEPGNANRGRGASALKDAGRLVYTLTTMSIEEAARFGISERDRTRHVRLDGAKINLIVGRPIRWFFLESQPLGNATELYPHGDEIQVARTWTPPDAWNAVTDDIMNRILSDIDKGMEDGNRYSEAANAGGRAAWKIIQRHIPAHTEQQARDIIKAWVDDGTLRRDTYDNPVTRKKGVSGLWVNKERLRPKPKAEDEELPF
jgi:hypothetical protein